MYPRKSLGSIQTPRETENNHPEEGMTSYQVQFVLPVDNPEKNVRRSCEKGTWTFEVPINYPNAHNLSYMDLVAACELSGLFTVPTSPNSDSLQGPPARLINMEKKWRKDVSGKTLKN